MQVLRDSRRTVNNEGFVELFSMNRDISNDKPPRKRAVLGGDKDQTRENLLRMTENEKEIRTKVCSRSEINQDPSLGRELNKMIYRCVTRSLKNRSRASRKRERKKERESVSLQGRMIETTEDYEINVFRELTMEF